MTPALETTGLAIGHHRRRADHVVLRALDVSVRRGEIVYLLGPNGSGKSTLLRTLGGFLPPLAGEVRIDGEELRDLSSLEIARRRSVVLTDALDVGMITGRDLVAMGRYPHTPWSGRLSELDHTVVTDSLDRVGAHALAPRPVSELSDGERQRLAVARALAQEPRLILLDEPTAFLDITGRLDLHLLMERLAHDHSVAVVFSTHDLELALGHADRLWLIDGASLVVTTTKDAVAGGTIERIFGPAAHDLAERAASA